MAEYIRPYQARNLALPEREQGQYRRFLQESSYVDTITTHIDVQTAAILGTHEQLKELGCEIVQGLDGGFESVTAALDNVAGSMQYLEATLSGSLETIKTQLESLRITQSDLLKVARTPSSTWAYEQYAQALDAQKRGLMPEALDLVHRAIHGTAAQPGYKLDHHFHFLEGMLYLGSPENQELVDLKKALSAFQLALRYVGEGKESVRILEIAAWTCFCLGDFANAVTYQKKNKKNGLAGSELVKATLTLGRYHAANREESAALECLSDAYALDRSCVLQVAVDPDYSALPGLASRLDVLRSIERSELAPLISKMEQEPPWFETNHCATSSVSSKSVVSALERAQWLYDEVRILEKLDTLVGWLQIRAHLEEREAIFRFAHDEFLNCLAQDLKSRKNELLKLADPLRYRNDSGQWNYPQISKDIEQIVDPPPESLAEHGARVEKLSPVRSQIENELKSKKLTDTALTFARPILLIGGSLIILYLVWNHQN